MLMAKHPLHHSMLVFIAYPGDRDFAYNDWNRMPTLLIMC